MKGFTVRDPEGGNRSREHSSQASAKHISVEEYIAGAERTIPDPSAMTVAERVAARSKGKKAPGGMTLWMSERQKYLLEQAFLRADDRSKQEFVRRALFTALEEQYGEEIFLDAPGH